MNVIKRTPCGTNFVPKKNKFDRLFDGFFCGNYPHTTQEEATHHHAVSGWNPATDIYETEDGYVLKLEVPGISKEELKIEAKEGKLTIQGERKENKEINKENYFRVESHSGKFSRTFKLPGNSDAKSIGATLKNGVLELRIAKPEEKKPKAVTIN
ncbi:MAG: Hsp20/alpha crystallin family protein [bacterium]|nr:Hsp20/alpha crystallin family protein [bacterium]